jgi:hypothetical protein
LASLGGQSRDTGKVASKMGPDGKRRPQISN